MPDTATPDLRALQDLIAARRVRRSDTTLRYVDTVTGTCLDDDVYAAHDAKLVELLPDGRVRLTSAARSRRKRARQAAAAHAPVSQPGPGVGRMLLTTIDTPMPCGTESARRRHAAHGRTCQVCESTPAPRPVHVCRECGVAGRPSVIAYHAELEQRVANAERRVAEVADWVRIAEENARLRQHLGDVGRAFAAMSMATTVDRALVQRWRRRLFNPTAETEGAAA